MRATCVRALEGELEKEGGVMTQDARQDTQQDNEQDTTLEAPTEDEATGAASEKKARTPRSRWIRRGVGLALGAGAGFAYYSFVGCQSGGCPIWQDPMISLGYGGLIGLLAIW